MATVKDITRWFFGVLVTTWLSVMLIISGHIAAVQLLPTTFWLDFSGVKVYQEQTAWWVELERTTTQNRDVRLQFEIHNADDSIDTQYCTASYYTTVETTKSTRAPIESAFAGCDLSSPFMQAKPLYLQVTYVIEVGYGFTRSVTLRSNSFTLNIPAKDG